MADATTVQTAAYTRLDSTINDANHFLEHIHDFVTLGEPNIDPMPDADYSQAIANLYDNLGVTAPTLAGQVISVPLPVGPTLTFSNIDTVTIPEFSQTSPSISIPTAPDINLPSVPAQPDVQDVALPTAPIIALPTAPVTIPINIPSPPSIDIPSFTASLPAEDFLTPSNTFSFAEQPYVSALLDAEKAKLLADLENGGYGIEPLDEINMWARARDREVDGTLNEIDEAYRAAGARGFPMPPGDTAVVVERALQKQQDKLSSVSREIAIKRADMFVENRKFTITEVRSLEQIMMNYWNSVQERGLNAAKATLDAAIAIYETQLKRYQARLDGYRTEAQVFEARIRAVAAQMEIYRNQIQAAQVTADVQRLQVETYNSQLKGVELGVQIYRTQMEAANIAASIQKVKIEAFQAVIQAYTAQVQAQVATQQAYEARIKGELAKAQVFETQARAYAASVEGLKAKAEVIIGHAKAEWEQAQVKVEKYKGDLQGAEINLKAQLGVVDANIKAFQARTGQYIATTNAVTEQLKLNETAIFHSEEIQVQQSEIGIKAAALRLQKAIATLTLQKDGLALAEDYYKNMIAALSGSIQAIATVQG